MLQSSSSLENVKQFIHELDHDFDIIAVSETWSTNEDILSDFQLEGYKMVNKNRAQKRGGGIKSSTAQAYFKFNTYEKRHYRKHNNSVEFENVRNAIIICICRTPGNNLDKFHDELKGILSSYKNNKHIFTCGDFNMN